MYHQVSRALSYLSYFDKVRTFWEANSISITSKKNDKITDSKGQMKISGAESMRSKIIKNKKTYS
ncbi:hypothetical protein CO165_03795 [Candidatus Roizmanbacteria bacterium CG_4_9_14_3_um_filter_33_18]|uniref:Uncharacterized protein n=1 Tax=Candidatus Roizmanbacteria bacterium CG_4_9_14_3_um_filter_33_18 TaxID=1974841 RepID=A0A2M7XXD5_9BACT|nr:MAG: hypothetical protein CO165_03795 [Candidatus Roizmanbacteria bacterium CG_4_9_14_3_um_filter_33_18]